MNKTLIGITLATLVISMFAFTGGVYAQAEVPPETPADEVLYLNHDERVAALVEMTGLTAEEIEARLAAGETAYDIAMSMNVPQEYFHDVWPMGSNGMAGEGMGSESGTRTQLRDRLQDGTCLNDCVPQQLDLSSTCEPQLLNLNLQDGSGAKGGRGNR
jgi:hypothetical protein